MLAVSGNGEARLGAWLDSFVAGPGQATDCTAAIPLRKAAACRGTENDGGKAPHSRGLQKRGADQNSAVRSALISSPIHISTTVVVVHAIGRSLSGLSSGRPHSTKYK